MRRYFIQEAGEKIAQVKPDDTGLISNLMQE